MGNQSASWYIPGEEEQPTGPFTAEQLFQSWQAGKLSDTTMCWREGMTQWLPLAQVEPFASAIRSAGASGRATAEVVRAGASPNHRKRLLIMVCAGAGVGVVLLAIVVAVLATRPNGGAGLEQVDTSVADAEPAKPPVADAQTTTVAPDGPLAGPPSGPADDHPAPSDARDALQGVWVVQSCKWSLRPDPSKQMRFNFQADKLLISGFGGKPEALNYSLDPNKSPKHLDFAFGRHS